MCLLIYTNSKTRPRYKIAKKDIEVFKVIKKIGYGKYNNLTIDHVDEKWTQGYEYEETTPFKRSYFYGNELGINGNCFHSKKTYLSAEYIKGDKDIIVKMIIPKGAKYYENAVDYASNRIIYPE